jgi:hypothetical protein
MLCDADPAGRPLYYRVTYLLNYNVHLLARTVSLSNRLKEAGLCGADPSEQHFCALRLFFGKSRVLSADELMTSKWEDGKFYYQIAAPVVNGFAYIGDVQQTYTGKQPAHRITQRRASRRWSCIKIYRRQVPSAYRLFFCGKHPKKYCFKGMRWISSYHNALLSFTPAPHTYGRNTAGHTVTIAYR